MDDPQTFSVDDLAGFDSSASAAADQPTTAAAITAEDFPLLHRWLTYDQSEFETELESLAVLSTEPELAKVRDGIEAASVALAEIYAARDVLLQ